MSIVKEDLKTNHIGKIKNVDFSLIPDAEEFQKIKVSPPNRFFNAIMAASIATIGICSGMIIALFLFK